MYECNIFLRWNAAYIPFVIWMKGVDRMKKCWLCAALVFGLMVGTAWAESRQEFPLPEDYVLLDRLWLDEGQAAALLLLGSESENAIRLGIAQRTNTGEYALSALTQPTLSYDVHDPELSLLYIPCQTDHPTFWWGFRNDIVSDELCLSIRQDEERGWLVIYGYVVRANTPFKYTFLQEAPGVIAISGDMPYPQISWQTDFPMALDGFDLAALENVCQEALAYLHAFGQAQGFGAQDGSLIRCE